MHLGAKWRHLHGKQFGKPTWTLTKTLLHRAIRHQAIPHRGLHRLARTLARGIGVAAVGPGDPPKEAGKLQERDCGSVCCTRCWVCFVGTPLCRAKSRDIGKLGRRREKKKKKGRQTPHCDRSFSELWAAAAGPDQRPRRRRRTIVKSVALKFECGRIGAAMAFGEGMLLMLFLPGPWRPDKRRVQCSPVNLRLLSIITVGGKRWGFQDDALGIRTSRRRRKVSELELCSDASREGRHPPTWRLGEIDGSEGLSIDGMSYLGMI